MLDNLKSQIAAVEKDLIQASAHVNFLSGAKAALEQMVKVALGQVTPSTNSTISDVEAVANAVVDAVAPAAAPAIAAAESVVNTVVSAVKKN